MCKAMSMAVKYTRSNKVFPIQEKLRLLHESLPSLELHRMFNVIESFFELCKKYISNNTLDETTQKLIDGNPNSIYSY